MPQLNRDETARRADALLQQAVISLASENDRLGMQGAIRVIVQRMLRLSVQRLLRS